MDKDIRRYMIATACVVIIVIASIIGISYVNNSSINKVQQGSLNEKFNVSEIEGNDRFVIFCNRDIEVIDGVANILAQNSITNNSDCRVKLYIDGNDNAIYESDIIKPGQFIEKARVSLGEEIFGDGSGSVVFEILASDGSIESSSTVKVNLDISWR